METSLQHEDLLIKLRAKLNEDKIKLWEPPYIAPDNSVNQSLKELAAKYTSLGTDTESVLNALHELQLHSLDRSKANAEFKETGLATFRVKATVPGERPQVFNIQKKLDALGSEVISAIATEIGVIEIRLKLIFNGKVVKLTPSLEEQGLKNGAQIMALIMTESPEEARQEDTMYMEMRQTRDDATLLSECAGEAADDELEYMKLEDQSGKTVELPPAERRSLVVGLALHEKGRAQAKERQYPLALVLLLEADRQLSECRSSILTTVDNWAVLQLDISWCYLCLQSLSSAGDAAARLARAERAFIASYGPDGERLVALKGNAANERVLFMRLYLLQGIVAYHQNKRAEAKRLLDKAEKDINALRVDETALTQLMELGWSEGAARAGLRAAGGEPTRAHNYLADKEARRDVHRRRHDEERERRALGICADGSPVNQQLAAALAEMGHVRRKAALALRLTNNHAADAVRILQEQPELLVESGDSSDDMDAVTDSPSSSESLAEPDERLVAELVSMGYTEGDAKLALGYSRNNVSRAIDILVEGGGHMPSAAGHENGAATASGPSTSTGTAVKRRHKKLKNNKSVMCSRRKERQEALGRLTAALGADEDAYLDTSLVEEEGFLAQYKSLL